MRLSRSWVRSLKLSKAQNWWRKKMKQDITLHSGQKRVNRVQKLAIFLLFSPNFKCDSLWSCILFSPYFCKNDVNRIPYSFSWKERNQTFTLQKVKLVNLQYFHGFLLYISFFYHSAQWLEGVTKPIKQHSKIDTAWDFLTISGCIMIE